MLHIDAGEYRSIFILIEINLKIKSFLNHYCFKKTSMTRELDRYASTRQILHELHRYRRKKTMLYRSNVALHEQRVLALIREAYPFIQAKFEPAIVLNRKLLEGMAEIHDDLELILGNEIDIAPAESSERRREELRAISKLNGHHNFTRYGIEAKDILFQFKSRRETVEAQIVAYVDTFDGFCEAIHEIAAGNAAFLKIPEEQRERLEKMTEEYLFLTPLLGHGHPLFDIQKFSEQDLRLPRAYHTTESLMQESGYAPYDFWRRALIMKGNVETFDSLITVKEGKKEEIRGLLAMDYV